MAPAKPDRGDHLAVDKYVDVRPHFALLCQHAIAQAGVCRPKLIQSFADGRRLAIDLDLSATASEFS